MINCSACPARLAQLAMLMALALPSPAAAQAVPAAVPSRADVVAAARDVMQKAVYCTFITIGEDGQPQARIVDPTVPDATFAIWIGTNPLTRKVTQVQRDARVTLLYFHAATASYVTVLGRAAVVTDTAEKARRWKSSWAPFYPKGVSDPGFMLIRVTPSRLEISSASRRMNGDAKSWLPLSIDFP